jgi:hypothetical protein
MTALLAAAAVFGLSHGAASARVLTEAEVTAKLSGVPIFAVTTKSGKPFFYDLDDGAREGRFFLEYDIAQDQVRQIPSRLLKPADATIRSVPLDGVYFTFVANKFAITGDTAGTPFRLLPSPKAVADAKALLARDKAAAATLPAINALNGAVPLFVEPTLQIKGATGVEQTPVFFSEADLLATYKRASPDGANSPQIRVTDLQTLIARMQTDESLDSESLVLVPSSSALAVAEASARVQADAEAAANAAKAPLARARTLSDEQVMSLPFPYK